MLPYLDRTALVGRFIDGEMIETIGAVVVGATIDSRGVLVPEFQPAADGNVYRREVTNKTSVGSSPMLRDPYEEHFLVRGNRRLISGFIFGHFFGGFKRTLLRVSTMPQTIPDIHCYSQISPVSEGMSFQ